MFPADARVLEVGSETGVLLPHQLDWVRDNLDARRLDRPWLRIEHLLLELGWLREIQADAIQLRVAQRIVEEQATGDLASIATISVNSSGIRARKLETGVMRALTPGTQQAALTEETLLEEGGGRVVAALLAAPPTLRFHAGPCVPLEAEALPADGLPELALRGAELAVDTMFAAGNNTVELRWLDDPTTPFRMVLSLADRTAGTLPGAFISFLLTKQWCLRYDSTTGQVVAFGPDGFRLRAEYITSKEDGGADELSIGFEPIDANGEPVTTLSHLVEIPAGSKDGARAARDVVEGIDYWRSLNPWLFSESESESESDGEDAGDASSDGSRVVPPLPGDMAGSDPTGPLDVGEDVVVVLDDDVIEVLDDRPDEDEERDDNASDSRLVMRPRAGMRPSTTRKLEPRRGPSGGAASGATPPRAPARAHTAPDRRTDSQEASSAPDRPPTRRRAAGTRPLPSSPPHPADDGPRPPRRDTTGRRGLATATGSQRPGPPRQQTSSGSAVPPPRGRADGSPPQRDDTAARPPAGPPARSGNTRRLRPPGTGDGPPPRS